MTKAMAIREYGGPEVFEWIDIDVGDPGPGQVRIKHEAVGLNFRDTYHRSGSYKIPNVQFPAIIGSDGAGVIEAIGEGVDGFSVGDRVVYCSGPMGSYCQARLMPAENVLKLHDGIAFETASAMMVKGLTARYLLRDSYDVGPGDTILIQAAAGGVGLIMIQWAKLLGATVIGTVSTDEKADLARSYGCDHTINYVTENFPARVQEITNGQGVDVVFDGVGKVTFEGDLDCLKPRGYLIGYGNASGNFPEFDPLLLMDKGSLYFQRTAMYDFVRSRDDLETMGGELMNLVADGSIRIEVNRTYPLSEAKQAHIDLMDRKTSGSVVYDPRA